MINIVTNSQNNAIKNLKGLIDPLVWGIKNGGSPFYVNRKDRVIGFINRTSKLWLQSVSLKQIREHQQGLNTSYFTANPRREAPECLLMVDIDCHGKGTIEGAEALADYIKTILPNLYCEPSTNGNGMHGYIIVRKLGHSAKEIKEVGKRLEQRLQALTPYFDISGIEIKGLPSVCEWTKTESGRPYLSNITFGSLAKLPRGDISQTIRIHINDLATIKSEPPISPENANVEISELQPGSCQPMARYLHLLDSQGVAELAKQAYYVARAFGHDPTGRERLTRQDFVALLAILQYCKDKPNHDGSLPVARIKALWASLHQAGSIDRAYSAKRLKAMRDTLSHMGLLDWQDERYWFFNNGSKGQACKWSITDDCADRLSGLALDQKQASIFRGTPLIRPRLVFPEAEPMADWEGLLHQIIKPWTPGEYEQMAI